MQDKHESHLNSQMLHTIISGPDTESLEIVLNIHLSAHALHCTLPS